MSIESVGATSNSTQVHPGPAAAETNPSASHTASSEPSPRIPSPPPAKDQKSSQPESQQAQTQQQGEQQPSPLQQASPSISQSPALQIAATTEKTTVVSATPSASSRSAAPSQPLSRPPPPASAVSLHDAAAKAAAAAAAKPNVANGTAPTAAASIAPKQPSDQVGAQSTLSGQQPQRSTDTTVASSAKLDAKGPAKKAPRAKANKPPGTTKPKQKRRTNQGDVHDELVYRPGPSTAGGTIGAAPDATLPAMLTAAGGGRKALPELVLPFQLPFAEVRPEMPMLDNASVQAAMAMGASETSSPDTGSDSDDYSVISDNSDLDSEAEESRKEARRRRKEPATIEESLVLLQSLRQSRLSHLSSLLTPFSQRVRSGMIYPNVLPLSLLHGLNPREPHVLIQLGRADIHVGPHIFMKTKFWEVRPDYEVPPVMDSVTGMHAPNSFGSPPTYARVAATQPLPQQLPKPQPPQLPSPRAALTVPQPSVPLARPPTAANKTQTFRPSPVTAPTSSTTLAQSPAASTQTAPTIAVASTPAAMTTPTLPAAPVPSSTGNPAAAPTKGPVSVPSTMQSVTAPASTPASAPALVTAAAPHVKPSTASAAVSATVPSSSKAAPAPSSSSVTVGAPVPAVISAPAAAASALSANAESKPATPAPPPVTLASKSLTVPVSLPRPPMATPSLPRPPSINQNNIPSSANPAATPSTSVAVSGATAKGPAQATATLAKPAGTPPAPGASGSAPPATASSATAAPAAASASAPRNAAGTQASGTPSTMPKPVATGTSNAAGTPGASAARPAGPPPPPAIDAVLVSRVNATAALNPELQELLHIAASGKANPNQLKALGVWIQAITAQLRQDEARNAAAANNAAGVSGPRAGAAASTTAEGKKSKKTKVDDAAKASKKQAQIEEREARKKAKAEAKAKAQADKQLAQKQQKEKQQKVQQQHQLHQQQQHPLPSNKLRHAPPGWPTDGPPKPPVIVVEFRENPSMRFILPLWKCLVERTEGVERPSMPKVEKERRSFFDNDSDDEESQKIEPELKLSFFAPSLGSDAADGSGLRELEEELKRKAAQEAKLSTANAASAAPQSNGAAKGAANTTASAEVTDKSEDTAATNGKKKKAGAASGKKSNKAMKQEVNDLSLSSDQAQSKKHEVYPLTWSIKGGVTESLWEAFGRVPGTMTCQPVKREPEIELEPDVAEFLVPEIRYHLLDLPMEEIKIQKETAESFADLYSQMPDRRFVLPRVAPALLPLGLEDHLQDRFAVRPQCIQGRPVVKRKAGAREDDVSFSYEGIGLTVIGPNGVKTEPGATPPKPPKRKRHVATHNPDGSIKSCGACGKTKTPMWRRGPKGPSQLCNACGARWKAGRLVVPEVAPPPIIEAEEDKSKEEAARKEDEAKASMHGSNALVIPQSSGIDDGSYTVMTSGGLVGAAPFGDHGGAGLFSLGSDSKSGGLDFGTSHLGRGSSSPSPFIRSPIPEDEAMPASVDPSMLSGSIRASSHRR